MKRAGEHFANAKTQNLVLGQSPRYKIEALVFIVLIACIIVVAVPVAIVRLSF
jgi:hypothetical protein